jgi:two-component system, NtrC family, response regulator AtoC
MVMEQEMTAHHRSEAPTTGSATARPIADTKRLSRSAICEDDDGERPLWLTLYHRGGAEAVPLRPGQSIVVGRSAPADVVIADPSLSRRHVRFRRDEDRVHVTDLGSTNGTWVGGNQTSQAVMEPGQTVMLGSVTAVLYGGPPSDALAHGLDSHDRFVAGLEREVIRARHFGRPFAVMMFRSCVTAERHVRAWAPRVQAFLRPADVAALYSAEVVEVLLPECGAGEAAGLARRIVDAADGLVCALAAFPRDGASVDRLLDSSWAALRQANRGSPVAWAESDAERVLDREPAGLVCESLGMQRALELAKRLARGVIPVLLSGETGCGKEVLARFIHDEGPRRNAPLVAVNCAALPSQLTESTLFGHEKGAFTGAMARRAGVFEAASGGTVFLDEVGELPLDAQAALLRVLETKRLTRVGATEEVPVDVRIVAATHRDLESMVRSGRFREDLFYRLNAITVCIPPLRERRADIAVLARRFLEVANVANQTAVVGIEPEALEALESYSWPGNVRELRNAVERAVVISERDCIGWDDLPQRLRDEIGPRPAAPSPASSERGRGACAREGEPLGPLTNNARKRIDTRSEA